MASTSLVLIIPMPHKHNADRRHHIPKMSFKVQNWPAYEAGLRRRGSLTLWIEDSALECWQTTGPSRQARYTDAAIETSLMLRTAFKLALRQAEGLMTSVLTLMGLAISAPDHSTVSRRAETLPVIQPATVPPGPLHVLIDSTGLQVDVVQKRPFWVTDAAPKPPARDGWISIRRWFCREAVSLPGSSAAGLKWPEAQQRQPMRMALAGHQFPRAFAVPFGTSAAHEAPMVQEEPQQVQVRTTQVTAQREVVPQP